MSFVLSAFAFGGFTYGIGAFASLSENKIIAGSLLVVAVVCGVAFAGPSSRDGMIAAFVEISTVSVVFLVIAVLVLCINDNNKKTARSCSGSEG